MNTRSLVQRFDKWAALDWSSGLQAAGLALAATFIANPVYEELTGHWWQWDEWLQAWPKLILVGLGFAGAAGLFPRVVRRFRPNGIPSPRLSDAKLGAKSVIVFVSLGKFSSPESEKLFDTWTEQRHPLSREQFNKIVEGVDIDELVAKIAIDRFLDSSPMPSHIYLIHSPESRFHAEKLRDYVNSHDNVESSFVGLSADFANPEDVFQVSVSALRLARAHADDKDIAFDLTGGTSVASAGATLALLGTKVAASYFPRDPQNPRKLGRQRKSIAFDWYR